MKLALRCLSVAFLAWHMGLLFPNLAEPWFLAVAGVVGLWGGHAVRGLRSWIALPTGVGVALLVRYVLTVVPTLLGGATPSPWDQFAMWADRQTLFSLLPFGIAWLEGWFFARRSRRLAAERLVHGVLAAAIFWSQGPYHVTLYPHPLGLALAFCGFLLLEISILLEAGPRRSRWAAAFLLACCATAFLWSLLGRYEDQSTAAGGGLMKPELFQFDFAPLVRLEDEITLGQNLVLLYREEGTPQPRYLRRLVLDAYDARNGFSMAQGPAPALSRKVQVFPTAASMAERVPVRQEYYLVNIDPSSLLVLNEPTTVTPYAQWNRSSFINAYRVDSLVPNNSLWLYNEIEDDGLTPQQRQFYTSGGDDPELRALAVSMTKGCRTPYEKASAILLSLKENYFYSLHPGPPGNRGALKHFLFESQKGYCSYFAFSMTLLLRSLGIPARIAVGFATDPSATVMGFNPVRAYQAHAWVEMPLGRFGWLEFDPTSSTPAPGEPFQFPKGSDPQELSKMIAEILEAHPQPLAEPSDSSSDPSRLPPQDWADWGIRQLPWLALVVLVAFNEASRQRWRWSRWRAKEARSRFRVVWRELRFHARRSGQGPLAAETPLAWARRVGDHDDLTALAQEQIRSRYDSEWKPQWPESLARFRRLRLGYRRALSPSKRLITALFPWWSR